MIEGGYFFSSRILFRVAQHAYERAKSAPTDAQLKPDDALVAVLFSAATLEAFVMEFAIEAQIGSQMLSKPSYLQEVADIMDEAESSRGSVRLKYLLAKAILPGQPYDKGAQPYQDFDLLFSLRDAIIHNKPEKIAPDPPKIARQLVARGLCEPEVAGTASSFLGRLKTRELARWACNVVADMGASLRKAFPVDNSSSPPTLFHLSMWSSGFDRVE